ncbi:hypothetical protein ACFL6Y_01420 [Elusimicrobiota bacterium]
MLDTPVRHKELLVFAVFGFLIYGATLIAERLTITSYYPSPYGAYKELLSTKNTFLATQSGYVGIGSVVPSATLPSGALYVSGGDVGQWSGVADMIRSWIGRCPAGSGCASGIAGDHFAISGVSNSNYGTISYGAGTNDVRLLTLWDTVLVPQGNVGIGTISPSRRLHIHGSDGMRLKPSSLPASPGAGDIAVDSDDSNKLKWHDGTSWVSAAGGGTLMIDRGTIPGETTYMCNTAIPVLFNKSFADVPLIKLYHNRDSSYCPGTGVCDMQTTMDSTSYPNGMYIAEASSTGFTLRLCSSCVGKTIYWVAIGD